MTRFTSSLLCLCLTAFPAFGADAPPVDQPIELETPTGKLYGSLLLPHGEGPVPVVLIHAGSGPTDRDGNNPLLPGANNSLKYLAEGLAAEGIASVRFDKRGIAASQGAGVDEAALRFESYVDDAVAWVGKLDADPRFSTVTIVGHSEGSLIGMLAAQRSQVDGYVSVAGVARRASDILREQLRPQIAGELAGRSEEILAGLEAGKTAESVPEALLMLYRPSVQPYLISWFRYVPTAEIAKLSVPVLILQGTTDIQVGTAEAEALKQARPEAALVVIDGMNHVLKKVAPDPAAQRSSYSDPALPIAPELVEAIAGFVHGLGAHSK